MKTGANEQGGHAQTYCASLIARGDADFHLSHFYALDEDRRAVQALFAFLIELRRIPAAVSEPPLGEIRLQWHRDALDEIVAGKSARAHPVIEALAASGLVDHRTRPEFERLIDARARLLYAGEFSSLEDFRGFLREAEAPVARLAVGAAATVDHAALDELSEAYALARFAPAMAPRFAAEAAAQSLRLLDAARARLNPVDPAAIGATAFLSLARGYAARPDGRPWPAGKRLAMVRAILTGKF